MTGIDDEMRSNYKLMSAMAVHTRVNPQMRIQRLLAFSRRLREEPEVNIHCFIHYSMLSINF
jgi:aubergine-like protein